ncbi:general transcription factor ii-i repeat domain-containing protein 2-like protein [Lasius niger]|uniref:General transcription factor ii-i repeat domain-containing protein 2-like protein n=1 Tax=Lasius niger TaxID=67767 RepID=A0A0J7JZ45_LASNI|nr:general transcription factor ii-i repeat domain-containing protein 2-like protein [Lasius niger]
MTSQTDSLVKATLDGSTDATDTAQLTIFIRGIDNEFNITEELASLVPLKNTTKSVDLYEAVKATLARFSLTIDNLYGIVTDGVPAMVGKKERLTKLIEDDPKKIGKPVPEFENENWLVDLAFLVDITAHLNELNIRLQD